MHLKAIQDRFWHNILIFNFRDFKNRISKVFNLIIMKNIGLLVDYVGIHFIIFI